MSWGARTPAPGRRAVRLSAVVMVIVVGAFFWHQSSSWGAAELDVSVYRDAARAFLRGGDVYAGHLGYAGLPFTYPPFALVVLVPLAVLPTGAAALVLFLASAAALLAVVRWSWQYAVGAPPSWAATILLAGLVAVLVEPVRATLGLGQVNLLLLALVVGLDARGTRASGVGAGIAGAIKVTPTLLVVAQAVRSDRRAFLRGLVALAAATGAGLVAAPALSREYFGSLLWDSDRPGVIGYVGNQSLLGAATRHLPGAASPVWLVAAAAVLVVAALAVRRHRRDAWLSLCTAALAGLLVSPVSWSHHWVWLLPLVAVGVRRGRRSALFAASVALVLVASVGQLSFWNLAEPALLSQDMYVIAGVAWLVASAMSRASEGVVDHSLVDRWDDEPDLAGPALDR